MVGYLTSSAVVPTSYRRVMQEIVIKVGASFSPRQIAELDQVERETDLQRTRIIRRAVEEFLRKYRAEHPGFQERVGLPVTREFKEGIETEEVVIRGKKTTVIMNPDGGWRMPVEDDYKGAPVSKSVLDNG